MQTQLFRDRLYWAYLSSPYWRGRRAEIMLRARGICERCKAAPATEIHHETYLRIFNELPTDLVALCRPCHAAIHSVPVAANDNQLELPWKEAG